MQLTVRRPAKLHVACAIELYRMQATRETKACLPPTLARDHHRRLYFDLACFVAMYDDSLIFAALGNVTCTTTQLDHTALKQLRHSCPVPRGYLEVQGNTTDAGPV